MSKVIRRGIRSAFLYAEGGFGFFSCTARVRYFELHALPFIPESRRSYHPVLRDDGAAGIRPN